MFFDRVIELFYACAPSTFPYGRLSIVFIRSALMFLRIYVFAISSSYLDLPVPNFILGIYISSQTSLDTSSYSVT